MGHTEGLDWCLTQWVLKWRMNGVINTPNTVQIHLQWLDEFTMLGIFHLQKEVGGRLLLFIFSLLCELRKGEPR